MSKNERTKLCKHCKTEIPAEAKICPNCKKKQSSIGKWIVAVIVIVAIGASAPNASKLNNKDTASNSDNVNNSSENQSDDQNTVSDAAQDDTQKQTVATNENTSEPESAADTKEDNENIPTEYKSALNSAKTYSDMMHMSKSGIYDQLISEYGDKFTKEDAQ